MIISRTTRLAAISAAAFAMTATPILGGAALADTPPARAWEIGPVIKSRNYSVGMPLRPDPAGDGISFEFPGPTKADGHVHYVTFNHGSLAGKRAIRMRYRIDAAPGTRFVPQEAPGLPGTIALFFQRSGDRWTGKGAYEHFRWYAPKNTLKDLAPGVHELVIPLDAEWVSVLTKPASQHRRAFEDAKAQAGRVGFVLGSRGGFGHGVYATRPARLTVLDFDVI